MAVSGAGSSGSSSAAAAAAAAEARRRAAEEARRRAEAARRAREQAKKAAEAAKKAAEAAAAKARKAAEAAKKAKPAEKPAAKEAAAKAERAAKMAKEAQKQAEQKLQETEERVVRMAKKAEDEMNAANDAYAKTAPGKATQNIPLVGGVAKPFSANEIAETGLKSNEIRNAFVGSGRRRDDIAKAVGVDAKASRNELQQSIDADRNFERLDDDPKTAKVLDKLDIRNGSDLQAFGSRLAREIEGGAPRADDISLKGIKDKDALASVISTAGATQTGKANEVLSDSLSVKLIAEGLKPKQVAEMGAEDRAVQLYRTELKGITDKPVEQWTAEEATAYTGKLAELAETYKDEPATVNALMTLSGAPIKKSAEILGAAASSEDVPQDEIQGLVDNLNDLGNTAPPKAAMQLAYAVGSEMPKESELREVDDAFGAYVDGGGEGTFRELVAASMAQQGNEDGAEELMVKGSGSLFSDPVGFLEDRIEDIGGVASDVAGFLGNIAEKGLEAAYNFVGDVVVGKLGDAIRNAAVSTLDLDGKMETLKEPGDSFTAALGVEGNLLGVQVGAGASMTVTMAEDGTYNMELSGEGSAALAEKLDIPGLGEMEGEVEGTASATLKFNFASVEEVTAATETVAGVTMGAAATAAGGPLAPIGAAMMLSAGDEISDIAGNYESVTVKLEGRGTLAGEIGKELGMPGLSAEASAGASVAIEIPKEGNPNLILTQSIEGGVSMEAGKTPLPTGGNFALKGQATASLEATTTIPLDVSVGELASDPLGELREAGETAISGATTSFKGKISVAAGAGVTSDTKPANKLGANEGLEISLQATGPTKSFASALGQGLSGNITGALSRLNQDVTVKGEVRAFEMTEAGVGSASERVDGDANQELEGEGVSVPGLGKVEVTAATALRSSRILNEFEGSPAELLRKYGRTLQPFAFAA